MAALFEEDGIQLLYPENWELQREDSENGWTISLQSPATAFFVLSFDAEMPEMEAMAQTALDALKGEYADLEADDCVESVAGLPAVGHDVRFFSLGLTNTLRLRSLPTGRGTALAWPAIDAPDLVQDRPALPPTGASM